MACVAPATAGVAGRISKPASVLSIHAHWDKSSLVHRGKLIREKLLCTELPTLENGLAVIEKQANGSDGVALTYAIRPDATWGDGVPVTTDDVLFTYEVGKHPQSGISNAELYRRITGIDVIDAKSFTMHVDRVTFEYNARLDPLEPLLGQMRSLVERLRPAP